MLSLKTIILKYFLVCVFLISPCCVHSNRRPDQNSKRRPFTSFCFVRFFKCVILFPCFVPRGKRVRSPRALMLAVRGSLRRRSRLSHPAVRGSLRRRSRLSHPAVRGTSRRRSRLSHPAVRGNSRRRLRIIQPSVPGGWRLHPRLTLARRPASDSMPAGLPLTQCPPACLWFQLARSAADSSSPDCRWLKLAGLPLTQARRIAADSCHWSSAGKANSPPHSFTPPSAAHLCFTCCFYAGKANPPSAVHSARSRLRLPPARRPLPLSGQASRLLPLLSSRPVMVSPAGRCRIWQASRPWPNLTSQWPRSF